MMMNKIKKLGFAALCFLAFNANAQTDKATTTKIVNDKNFIFAEKIFKSNYSSFCTTFYT